MLHVSYSWTLEFLLSLVLTLSAVGFEVIRHCVGANAKLRCVGPEHVNEIVWKTKKTVFAQIKSGRFQEGEGYKNRIEHVPLNASDFSVSLKNVSISDKGIYSCFLKRELHNEVQLYVTEPPAAECMKPTESPPGKHVDRGGKTGMEDTKLDEDVEKAAPTRTWAISLGVCCAALVCILVPAGVYIYRRAGRGNHGGVDAGCTDAESVPVQPKRPDNTEEETPHEHHQLTADHTNGDLTMVQKSLKSSSTMSESA